MKSLESSCVEEELIILAPYSLQSFFFVFAQHPIGRPAISLNPINSKTYFASIFISEIRIHLRIKVISVELSGLFS